MIARGGGGEGGGVDSVEADKTTTKKVGLLQFIPSTTLYDIFNNYVYRETDSTVHIPLPPDLFFRRHSL